GGLLALPVLSLVLACGRFGFSPMPGGGDGGGGGDDGPGGDAGAAVRAITAGHTFACAVRDGAIWCWGDDHNGQLGGHATPPRAPPVRVPNISDATAIAAGGSHVCALRSDGSVWCWGHNASGQVGPAPGDQRTPVRISGLGVATALALGGDHSCARLADATAWCWGGNDQGQLGFTGSARPNPGQALGDGAAISARAVRT